MLRALSLGSVVSVAVVAAVDVLPQPEGVWPVTVTGWIGLFVAFLSLAGVIWTFHRAGVDRAKKDTLDDARMTAFARELNDFRLSVEAALNGFGRRMEIVEHDSGADRSVVNGVLQSFAEWKADRKHMGDSLIRIEASIQEMRREFNERSQHGR